MIILEEDKLSINEQIQLTAEQMHNLAEYKGKLLNIEAEFYMYFTQK